MPRYRQRIAEVPAQQGRPVWVDDPHFNLRYHLRHTALPHPGGDEELRRLAGRVFAQRLDRDRPLWEIWMVEGLRDGRWAMLSKTHHALVDGVSGVDITTIMYDLDEHPPHRATAPSRWEPRPLPTKAQLLASAITERLVHPHAIFDEVVALTVRPRRAAEELLRQVRDLGAFALVGVRPVPLTPLNVQIGPHRRYTWVDADLAEFKQIKNHLGGTVNDVVLAAVAGALGRFLRRRGFDTDGVVLRAMVPVSVRTADERGALGNKVAAMWAPLPVGIEDPVDAARRGAPVDGPPQGLRPGRRRADAHRAPRIRTADDPRAGDAADAAPAVLQRGRDERARARSSPSTSWAAACVRCTRSCPCTTGSR